jgi:hypothetical protein
LYSHRLIALTRVDVGSCGNGVGCIAGSDNESEADEEVVVSTSVMEVVIVVVIVDVSGGWVLEVVPNAVIIVPEIARPGVVINRRATCAVPEQEVMNIAV